MIDLHVHSTASDGKDTPDQLIYKAKERGLTAISLTDHDSIQGLTLAESAAQSVSLLFIPGIEITTDYLSMELHILGYYVNYRNPQLVQFCQNIQAGRQERAQEILSRLSKYGYNLSWEEVVDSPNDFVGRSHILDKLVDKGLVTPRNQDAFFDLYLSKAGRAYVPHYYVTPAMVIGLIRESGGVPVLAHPGRMRGHWDLAVLVAMGIAGLEVWYPLHTEKEVIFYLEQARQFRLIPTGGTDYHGRGQQLLGWPGVPEKTIERLQEAAAN